ncbi:MAG: hypothetical protein H6Q54_581, partial [Deltaproteobacteria bacterium]|nr:hypothetical protein [Deltaproteobacteria bacterium]
ACLLLNKDNSGFDNMVTGGYYEAKRIDDKRLKYNKQL